MTADRPATEPRTEAGKQLAARAKRESWSNWEGLAQFTILAIEQQARDEGCQEAVDTIRSRVLTTPCYRPGCICEDGPVARHTLHRILDDVARHGRPSDPEPAPHCLRCGYPIEREGQLCLATRQRTECRSLTPVSVAIERLRAALRPSDERVPHE